MERTDWFGRMCYWDKQTINNNTYIIVLFPPKEDKDPHRVNVKAEVYATYDGRDEGLPETPDDLRKTDYEKKAEKSTKQYYFEKHPKYDDYGVDDLVNDVLNEAICEVESKQEKEQQLKDKVNAVIEANKEVHGGLEHKIDQLDNSE